VVADAAEVCEDALGERLARRGEERGRRRGDEGVKPVRGRREAAGAFNERDEVGERIVVVSDGR